MRAVFKVLTNESRIQDMLAGFSREEPYGVLSEEELARLLLLGYVCGLSAEDEIERDVRMDKDYRKFCDYDGGQAVPSGAVISYSRRLYEYSNKAFCQKLEELLLLAAGELPNLRLREPAEYIKALNGRSRPLVNPPVSAPCFLYRHEDPSGRGCIRCSGGCAFYKQPYKPEPDERYPDPDKPPVYRAQYTMTSPFVPSTLKNCTKTKPDFPLGKVYGIRERFELGEGDSEGGLRTRGIYKRNTPERPLITYVTVVYNRVNVIRRCMESIWTQSYSNIEYIVVDGASTDGTLEYIKENEDKIDYFVSQPDKGLYDAMNKGVSLASGQYVCMMNSDDWCTPNAAEIVSKRCIETRADVISGLVIFNNNGEMRRGARRSFLFPNNTLIYPAYFHQGLYGSRDAFETAGYFDLSYYPMSDFKWTSVCVNKGMKFDMWDEHLAFYTTGGGTATTDSNITAQNNYFKFTCETFSFLSVKQAGIYHYTLFMTGAAFWLWERELMPCLKAIKEYLDLDGLFRVTVYRAALYGYFRILELIPWYDAIFTRGRRRKLMIWLQSEIGKKCKSFAGAHTPHDLLMLMVDKLKESVERGESDEVSYEALLELARLKSIINKYLRKHHMLEAPFHKKLSVFAKSLVKQVLYNSGSLTSVYVRRKCKEKAF